MRHSISICRIVGRACGTKNTVEGAILNKADIANEYFATRRFRVPERKPVAHTKQLLGVYVSSRESRHGGRETEVSAHSGHTKTDAIQIWRLCVLANAHTVYTGNWHVKVSYSSEQS